MSTPCSSPRSAVRYGRVGGEVVRHLQVLRAEAGSGTVRGIGLVSMGITAVATSLVSVTAIWPGLGNVLNSLLTITIYLAPIGLGSAAVRTSASSQHGMGTVAASSPRRPGAAVTLTAAAVTCWQVLALVVGFLVLVSRLGVERGEDRWSVLLLPLLAVLVVATATMVGAWAGHHWPAAAVAPLGVVLSFALMYFLSYTGAPASKLSVIYSGTFYRPELVPNTDLLTAQILLLAGLLVLGGAVLRTSWLPRVLTGAVAALMVAAGIVGVQQAPAEPVRFAATPATVRCLQEAGTRLCVWPTYQQDAAATLTALVAARAVADPLLTTPALYRQDGLDVAGQSAVIYLDPPPTDVTVLAEAAARAVVPGPCPGDLSDPAADEASFNLSSYIAAQIGGYQPPLESAVATAAAPLAQQQAWAQTQLAQITPCRDR